MKHLCFDIAYNYYAQKPGFEFRCISDINRIFGYFIAAFPHQFLSVSNIYHAFRTERRMMRILKYIDHHFMGKITLAEIAKMEDVSVPYLSQQFHSYVNMTFQEYIKQLRFEKACFLLSKTTLSLYDICIESGFSDQKYLTLAFKDAYGMTPSQYRKQYVSTIHLEQAHSKLKTFSRLSHSNHVFRFFESIMSTSVNRIRRCGRRNRLGWDGIRGISSLRR